MSGPVEVKRYGAGRPFVVLRASSAQAAGEVAEAISELPLGVDILVLAPDFEVVASTEG